MRVGDHLTGEVKIGVDHLVGRLHPTVELGLRKVGKALVDPCHAGRIGHNAKLALDPALPTPLPPLARKGRGDRLRHQVQLAGIAVARLKGRVGRMARQPRLALPNPIISQVDHRARVVNEQGDGRT